MSPLCRVFPGALEARGSAEPLHQTSLTSFTGISKETFIYMIHDSDVVPNPEDFPSSAEQSHNDERAFKPLKGFFFSLSVAIK